VPCAVVSTGILRLDIRLTGSHLIHVYDSVGRTDSTNCGYSTVLVHNYCWFVYSYGIQTDQSSTELFCYSISSIIRATNMSFADPWKPTACTSEVIMMTSGIAIMPLVGQMSVALSIFSVLHDDRQRFFGPYCTWYTRQPC
jgi:hypothetical protein